MIASVALLINHPGWSTLKQNLLSAAADMIGKVCQINSSVNESRSIPTVNFISTTELPDTFLFLRAFLGTQTLYIKKHKTVLKVREI